MTAPAPTRLACPCCLRDIGVTRGSRLMPHTVNNTRNAIESEGEIEARRCPGSRAPVDLLDAIAAALLLRTAVVAPASLTEPCRVIHWSGDDHLLAALCAAIDCELVETWTLPLAGPGNSISVWVDEEGSLHKPVSERVTRMNGRAVLYPTPVYGTAVLTGEADEDGETLGLTRSVIKDLLVVLGGPE